MNLRDIRGRPRVYITVRRGQMAVLRVLDLAYIAPDRPIAVISWVKKDGALAPGNYIELDPALLRQAAPLGTFQYDGIAEGV